MERFDYRNPNNPHSPTHRSPDLVPQTLSEIVEEKFVGPNRLRNQFGMEHSENDPNSPPGVRFQDQRGPGIRPAQYYQRNNNNRASEVPPTMYAGDPAYESAESSVSSPMSSGKTPQFHDPEYPRYGYNGDDDEANSMVSHNTTKEEHRTDIRSTLSSLNYNSDWGSIWDAKQPEFRLLHEGYQTRKQDIFKDIENTMEKLRTLERDYERAKDDFHNKLSMEYKELCQGLVQKRNRLSKAKADFEASANIAKDDATLPNDKVKLNVGGVIFVTSLATLRKESSSLLAMMFSGRHQLVPEDNGSYFIDRDPTHFRYILNYLRDTRISPSAFEEASVRHELLQEAKYYKIDSLIQYLQQQEQ